MHTIEGIYTELEETRKRLHEKIEATNDLKSPDIIMISQELDKIINRYNKVQSILKVVALES